ncbi:MAG: phage tailspike protein [Peptostreptococcaceae bacterium]
MTANILVTSPYQPFTMPKKFSAVFNGYVWCGVVDKDPQQYPVKVYVVNEDGSRTEVSQPLRTNAGGFLVYNGNPANFVTDSNHSLLVQDSNKGQVWYEPDMSTIDPQTAISILGNQSREALRRSYAEAGFNLVSGSFESGGKLVNHNDVLMQSGTGKAFSGPAGTVAAGTDPYSGAFTDESNSLLVGRLDFADVDWYDGNLVLAIRSNPGKKIYVNSDITVNEIIDGWKEKVTIKGSGEIKFAKDFLVNFESDFVVSGVTLTSEDAAFVVRYKKDAKANVFALVNGAKLTGRVRFIYESSNTLNPSVSKYGVETVWLENISVENTLESLMYFDNMPYDLINVSSVKVRNFSKVFLSSAISNNHPYAKELQLSQRLMSVSGNNVLNDDNWWTTSSNTESSLYGGFIFHEGSVLRYHNNTINGIKSRRQASDAGKSCTTAYWLYMGGIDSYVHDNDIKNCFHFGSLDNPNVAFKLKNTTNLHAHDNKYSFDGDWLSRIGESLIGSKDYHVIHDVEPGKLFFDVELHDNLIELIADTYPVNCNASKYYFRDNVVRRGPTDKSVLTIGFPTISYSDKTLTEKPVFEFEDNVVTNEGGSIVAPYVSSMRVTPFRYPPIINNKGNGYVCRTLSSMCRMRGSEEYIATISNNTATVTNYGSVFSEETGNSSAAVIIGTGNSISSIPSTLTTQKGFGLIPFSRQADISLSVSSEGSISLGVIGADTNAPSLNILISGKMKTSEKLYELSFSLKLRNDSQGVNRVEFIDTDGSTQRVVKTNASGAFFAKQGVNGTPSRLYVSGDPSRNIINLALSESQEGVITDKAVIYDLNLYIMEE